MTLMMRSRSFHLVRRVPTRYRAVDARERISMSLHTDSPSIAGRKAAMAWEALLDAWEARLDGDAEVADRLMKSAHAMAGRRGSTAGQQIIVPRLSDSAAQPVVSEVIQEPQQPLSENRETMQAGDPTPVAAQKSQMTVLGALNEYWSLAVDRIIGMSQDQMRRWRNPRLKAVKNFVEVIGDKRIDFITADDMLDFRMWWVERIRDQGLTANSGDKDLTHLSDVLRTVNRLKRLGLSLPLSELAIKEREQARRPGFSEAWIRSRLLAPGALDGLNTEARVILLTMINTGARPSEIANLTASRIRLDASIPHIAIEGEGRLLKSRSAQRVIPLCGVSLSAIKECPKGFPRYRDTPTLSGTQNKFLRENGLLETAEHSVYSLRHSFESRMIAAGIDDRVRRDLFGHSLNRERYGEVSLSVLQQAILKVSI
ncbi:integrase [Prosthecomicrobium hirschii]|uniref:tyrosine-type recombinase/integrase n=1 Tax=Prosthecodimorpha hirschii TaxID=665126 RepID=UPI00112DAF32|nr:tyrosine-type recombinase/integrase [Prosthecomicrobium hirschii]TPQ46762.1 integrase [Prosthecomicrobium hirschii]